MNALITRAAVFAAAVVLCPDFGMAQQSRVVPAAANGPNPRTWMERAQANPRAQSKPAMKGAAIERAVSAPVNAKLEPPVTTEVASQRDFESHAMVEASAMLRPTWDGGFWVLPPGGLTRFLIPSRAIINVDQTPLQATTPEASPPP